MCLLYFLPLLDEFAISPLTLLSNAMSICWVFIVLGLSVQSLFVSVLLLHHMLAFMVVVMLSWLASVTLKFLSWNCFIMSSRMSVVLSLDSWSLRYCSDVMDVAFTCLLFLVISHSISATCILYDWLLRLWSPLSTIVPWVQGLVSSLWTTTIDLLG